MRTRTYTHYFSKDQIEPLMQLLIELKEDWDEREQYVSEYDQIRGSALLSQAKAGILLLNERTE